MSVQERCASPRHGGVKKFLCAGMAIFMALCIFLLVGCADEHDPKETIKVATGIEIPEEAKMLYHHCDATFHPGRHENYTVFAFEKEPADWLMENNFLPKKNENYEDSFLYSGFGLLELSSGKNIPDEYIPDFEKPYLWLETQLIYFAYFTETLRLFVFISPD